MTVSRLRRVHRDPPPDPVVALRLGTPPYAKSALFLSDRVRRGTPFDPCDTSHSVHLCLLFPSSPVSTRRGPQYFGRLCLTPATRGPRPSPLPLDHNVPLSQSRTLTLLQDLYLPPLSTCRCTCLDRAKRWTVGSTDSGGPPRSLALPTPPPTLGGRGKQETLPKKLSPVWSPKTDRDMDPPPSPRGSRVASRGE